MIRFCAIVAHIKKGITVMKMFGALLFAFIAAAGNAVFVYGHKKSSGVENPFVFIVITVTAGLLITLIAVPFWGKADFRTVLKANYLPAVISGIGLFITYTGFNLLYSRYGASQYVLYAVLSILTTSIIVGIFIFKENFNIYHMLSVITAIATIGLFTMGQVKG